MSNKKKCHYCEKEKDRSEFPKHILYRDNLDTRCKDCKSHSNKTSKRLKKTAPPRPEVCEICGRIPHKWVIDHDHTDDTFRGHICDTCNCGLGKLGDDIPSIINALNYLLRIQNRNRLDKDK